MSHAEAARTSYRPEVVAELLKSHEHEAKAAEAKERRRLFAPGRRALKWFAGAALVAGLSGIGLWSSPKKSAEAAEAPRVDRIELAEVVVVASATPAAPPADGDKKDDASPAPTAPAGVLADGRVVLNLATEDELTKLPHVGPSRAKAIVALRTKLGKFRQMSELLRVKGIGRKTLAKLAPKIVLDPPKDAP